MPAPPPSPVHDGLGLWRFAVREWFGWREIERQMRAAFIPLREEWRQLRAWWRSPDSPSGTGRWFLILRRASDRQARWRRVQRFVASGVLADALVRSRLRYLSVRAAAHDTAQETYIAAATGMMFLLL